MHKKLFNIISAALICLTFFLGSAPDIASAQEGLVVTVQAGLDEYCKPGTWTPVSVTIENTGPNLDGTLSVKTSENLTEWFFNTEVSIPSVSRKAYTIYVYPPAVRLADIEVSLTAGGKQVYSEQFALNCLAATDNLLGVWAENPSLFNPQTDLRAGGSRSVLLVLDETSIPDRPQGLEMLTSLTISNVDAGRLTGEQRSAIETWVTRGGKLLITGGPNWPESSNGFENLLPFEPTGTITVDDLNGLLNLSPGESLLSGPAVITSGNIRPGAAITAGIADRPLIVSRSLGFGTVTFLVFDPTLEPLRTWTGIGDLYNFLLGAHADTPPWNAGFQDWMSAQTALNTIEGLGAPPFILICGFIILYTLVVGPLNFIILRRRKKREAAWVSVPVLVIGFTGLVLLISSTMLGNRPVMNRLSVVEVWPGAKIAQTHGLVGIFSPQRETFQVRMEGDFIASPLPQVGFGSDGWNHRIFQRENGFTVPELRVDLGGLQSIVISGQVPAPAFDASYRIEIDNTGSPTLTGSFTNLSELTLRDAVLLSSGLPSTLGDISPGETVSSASVFSGGRATSSGTAQNYALPGFGYDSTLDDLFQTTYLPSSNAATLETYRRFNLMTAALGGLYNSRGGGIYLVGWTDSAPYTTEIPNTAHSTTDTTLYVYQIRPETIAEAPPGSLVKLPPGLFSWDVYEAPIGGGSATPYEGYLNTGAFSLRFAPNTPVYYTSVESLELHMESYGAGGDSNLNIYLWDFSKGAWWLLPPVDWGDTTITPPDRFVGADGEIRIKVENTTLFSVSIERVDFTLTLRR